MVVLRLRPIVLLCPGRRMADSAAEYERRRIFCESIKTMTRPEHIEIARILQRNQIAISENRNGLFFDVAKIPGDVFEEILRFREFVSASTAELAKRDVILRGLKDEATQIE
jgi:hypothetical protein